MFVFVLQDIKYDINETETQSKCDVTETKTEAVCPHTPRRYEDETNKDRLDNMQRNSLPLVHTEKLWAAEFTWGHTSLVDDDYLKPPKNSPNNLIFKIKKVSTTINLSEESVCHQIKI